MSFLLSSTQTLLSSLAKVSTYCQKQLVKQCLSPVVDTDGVALSNIAVQWGLRECNLEIRDVGLRLEVVASALSLPPALAVRKARVAALRLTVPTTGASAIIVEVESPELRLQLTPETGDGADREPTREPATDTVDRLSSSTADLQTVIESAPEADKADLEAALPTVEGAFSSFLRSFGTLFANGPATVARLLKDGAINRLQARVTHLTVRLDVGVEDNAQPSDGVPPSVPVGVLVSVGEVSMGENARHVPGSTERRRRVEVNQLQVYLVSDPGAFQSHARFMPPVPAMPDDTSKASNASSASAATASPSESLIGPSAPLRSSIAPQHLSIEHCGPPHTRTLGTGVALGSTTASSSAFPVATSQSVSFAQIASVRESHSDNALGQDSLYHSAMTAATTTIVDDTQQDPVARMPGAFAASVMEAPGLRDAPLGQVVMESQLPPEAQDALDSAMTSARQLVQVPQVTLDLLSDDVQAQCTQQSAAAYPSASPPSAVMQASSTSTSPDFLASSLVAPGPSLQPQQPQSTADCTETLEVGKDSQRIEIVAPALKTQVDIPCSWLLAKWSVGLSTALARPPSSGTKTEAAKASRLPLKVDLQALDFRFATALPDISLENGDVRQGVFQPVTPMSNLVEMQLRAVHADCQLPLSSAPSTLTLARYTLRCGDRDFFRFSASMAQQQSRWQSNREPRRVDVRIVHEPEPGAARLSINTAPAVAMLDIAIVDELLTWVGGLSSILGQAGPNTPPSVAPTTVERSPRSRRRNIRFENDPMPTTLPPEGSMPEVAAAPVLKVNARVNGLSARLIGEACSIDLETSPLKLISRAGHIALQVDHARLSGPHNEQDTVHGTHQTVASVTNTRLEYLNQPEEADLDKLLALLTPSKDKFGPDDGLILDTLFRQRMQGPVLRLNVEKVAMQVPEASQLQALASIADDLDRLSRVAKYLPADDRPGILLVSRCQSVTVEVTLTDLLGNISISMTGAEIAHVALPPLSAGKVQTLKITRNGDITLLGPATAPPLGHEQSFDHSSPMIMARYLSEELEPTLTVKLFDCLLEYHIPTVLAFLGVNMDHADSEILKQRSPDTANAPSGFDEQASEGSQTTLGSHSARRVAIALRDCHIGLRCQHTPARGLLVLSSGQFHGSLEAGPLSQASLEVHRGSFLINDNITQQTPSSQRGKRHAIGDAHLQELCAQGFVLVASLSSTKLFATATRSSETLTSVIDAQLSDTLLILETCADSTQTLITLLNGLALPIPSVQGQKYRTEVVPIQEMLRSLGQESFRQTYSQSASHFDRSHVSLAHSEIREETDYVSDFSPVAPCVAASVSPCSLQPPAADIATTTSPIPWAPVSSDSSDLDFQENYFAQPQAIRGVAHKWDSTTNTYSRVTGAQLQSSPLRIGVRNVHIIWNLYDGYDWKMTRDTISQAVHKLQSDATDRARRGDGQSDPLDEDEESVVGDFLFNSIYIDIPPNHDPQTLPDLINQGINDFASETTSQRTSTTMGPTAQPFSRPAAGKPLKLARSKRHKITIELKGVAGDLVIFPPGRDETQSSLDIRVEDLEIFDHITTSTWKKFATYMRDAGERETGASMVHIELLTVKPVPDLAASEIVLKATVLPLRLHVDQDALDFLTRFFAFKDDSQIPDASPAELPFIQRAEVNSVPIKLDFKPKRIDYDGLRSGRTTEFMNFFVLDEANMTLRHCIIYGISGFEKLGQTLNDIWMPDIRTNQLPGVLAGLAPIKPLVGVSNGLRNLVVVPVKEYRRDGRVVRSLQKGATSFAKTTTTELVKMGAKLAIGTQTALQSAESFFTKSQATMSDAQPLPADALWEDISIDHDEKAQVSLYAHQPIGVKQGLRGGYSSLSRDLALARDVIIAVPAEVTDSGSATQAARALLRRAPTIILRPAIGATKAVGQTLLGAGNTLDPAQRRRNEDKYKHH